MNWAAYDEGYANGCAGRARQTGRGRDYDLGYRRGRDVRLASPDRDVRRYGLYALYTFSGLAGLIAVYFVFKTILALADGASAALFWRSLLG